MGVDDKSAVLKAITNGACDYWIKPMSENQIKNMWQHVLRKLLNESKNQENNKNLEVEDMKKGEGDVSKLSLIDGTIIGYIKNNLENNKDNHESSTKKARFVWSPELHEKFVSIVTELNIDSMILFQFFFFLCYFNFLNEKKTFSLRVILKFLFIFSSGVTPKKILERMNVTGLTRRHVASHLQVLFFYFFRLCVT
jgi:two-component response regulator (ARR-B family)